MQTEQNQEPQQEKTPTVEELTEKINRLNSELEAEKTLRLSQISGKDAELEAMRTEPSKYFGAEIQSLNQELKVSRLEQAYLRRGGDPEQFEIFRSNVELGGDASLEVDNFIASKPSIAQFMFGKMAGSKVGVESGKIEVTESELKNSAEYLKRTGVNLVEAAKRGNVRVIKDNEIPAPSDVRVISPKDLTQLHRLGISMDDIRTGRVVVRA